MAWNTVVDAAITSDTGSWTTTVTAAISTSEGSLWRNPIVSPTSASFINVGEAPENLLVDIEDMTLVPELIQDDFDDWVLLDPPS